MTLPGYQLLPFPKDFEDYDSVALYLRALLIALETRDDQVTEAVNGNIRASVLSGTLNWTPVLKGTVTPGTFTYTKQTGYVLRQGLMTDVWADIEWSSAGTAAGNLYLELPYKVALVENMPFVGLVQPSVFAYTGGTEVVINAISDTYRGELWNTGTGFTTARQAVVGAGRIIVHLRYIGTSNG